MFSLANFYQLVGAGVITLVSVIVIFDPTRLFPVLFQGGLRLRSNPCRKGRRQGDLVALQGDPHYQSWFDRLRSNLEGSLFGSQPISVEEIRVDDVDMFGSRFGFGKFQVVTKPFIPGIVFHRSPSVCVLYLVQSEGALYGLLTLQARVPSGYRYLPELLAGMLDAETGNCHLVAAKEVEEEAGLRIDPTRLVDLGEAEAFHRGRTEHLCATDPAAWDWYERADPVKTHQGYFNSPGGSSESTRFYLYHEDLDKAEFQALVKRLETEEHGVVQEGERIRLMLVPIDHLLDVAPDMKVGHALALRERYLRRFSEV